MRLKIRKNLRISLPEHKIYWLLHIGAARIFDWEGGPNHKSHSMALSEIIERDTFCGAKML